MKGFFGDTFDFNGDGNLDAMEQAADFGMFVNMVESEEQDSDDVDFDDSDFDMDDLDF